MTMRQRYWRDRRQLVAGLVHDIALVLSPVIEKNGRQAWLFLAAQPRNRCLTVYLSWILIGRRSLVPPRPWCGEPYEQQA